MNTDYNSTDSSDVELTYQSHVSGRHLKSVKSRRERENKRLNKYVSLHHACYLNNEKLTPEECSNICRNFVMDAARGAFEKIQRDRAEPLLYKLPPKQKAKIIEPILSTSNCLYCMPDVSSPGKRGVRYCEDGPLADKSTSMVALLDEEYRTVGNGRSHKLKNVSKSCTELSPKTTSLLISLTIDNLAKQQALRDQLKEKLEENFQNNTAKKLNVTLKKKTYPVDEATRERKGVKDKLMKLTQQLKDLKRIIRTEDVNSRSSKPSTTRRTASTKDNVLKNKATTTSLTAGKLNNYAAPDDFEINALQIQQQKELHERRMEVENKRMKLLDAKVIRQYTEMERQRQLFEQDLQLKLMQVYKLENNEN